jgi:hypothetical protein
MTVCAVTSWLIQQNILPQFSVAREIASEDRRPNPALRFRCPGPWEGDQDGSATWGAPERAIMLVR